MGKTRVARLDIDCSHDVHNINDLVYNGSGVNIPLMLYVCMFQWASSCEREQGAERESNGWLHFCKGLRVVRYSRSRIGRLKWICGINYRVYCFMTAALSIGFEGSNCKVFLEG